MSLYDLSLLSRRLNPFWRRTLHRKADTQIRSEVYSIAPLATVCQFSRAQTNDDPEAVWSANSIFQLDPRQKERKNMVGFPLGFNVYCGLQKKFSFYAYTRLEGVKPWPLRAW